MESNVAVGFRHRRSPSSDRFLDVFSPPKSGSSGGVDSPLTGYELNEAEVFWTGDFAESKGRSTSPTDGNQISRSQSFRQKEKFGILAALQEDSLKLNRPVINRKPSFSPSSPRLFPAIPKPPQERDYSQSAPSRKLIHSAPMKVPVIPRKAMKSQFAEMDSDDAEEEEMLPPHEIVARGSTKSPYATFSVLEGAGRTLKGRDLRQVRNAVFRQTGFLD